MKTKKNPEIPMVPKIHLKNVEHQRDQYKAERDTLIDDIAVIRANSERYRKRAENAMDYAERSQCEILRLEREIKKKNMDADRLGYRWRNSHDEAKTYKSLLSEFSQHIGNKPSSSTYKYFRAKLDELGIKEGE